MSKECKQARNVVGLAITILIIIVIILENLLVDKLIKSIKL